MHSRPDEASSAVNHRIQWSPWRAMSGPHTYLQDGAAHTGSTGRASPWGLHVPRSTDVSTGTFVPPTPVATATYVEPVRTTSGSGKSPAMTGLV